MRARLVAAGSVLAAVGVLTESRPVLLVALLVLGLAVLGYVVGGRR